MQATLLIRRYTIDQHYLSGLSITHGAPGSRIWSYAAGPREGTSSKDTSEVNCPCAAHPSTEPLTPDYVGDHFYCDTAMYILHTKSGMVHQQHTVGWQGLLSR